MFLQLKVFCLFVGPLLSARCYYILHVGPKINFNLQSRDTAADVFGRSHSNQTVFDPAAMKRRQVAWRSSWKLQKASGTRMKTISQNPRWGRMWSVFYQRSPIWELYWKNERGRKNVLFFFSQQESSVEDVQDLRDLEMPEEQQESAEEKGDEPHGENQFDGDGHLITWRLSVSRLAQRLANFWVGWVLRCGGGGRSCGRWMECVGDPPDRGKNV